jgi:hypothetical protein
MIAREIANAVVRVGDGRGFIIEAKRRRLVVTAAHCLPWLPATPEWCDLDERTYQNLLGPLGDIQPTVWAECLFADPLADVAILGSPDGQELYAQAEAHDALTDDRPALRIADAPTSGRAWLLSLAGEWNPCRIERLEDDHPFALGASLIIKDATAGIHGGMSGSPIVTDDGAAVGILAMSSGIGTPEGTEEPVHTEGGPNPRLFDCLPGWLLRSLKSVEADGQPGPPLSRDDSWKFAQPSGRHSQLLAALFMSAIRAAKIAPEIAPDCAIQAGTTW